MTLIGGPISAVKELERGNNLRRPGVGYRYKDPKGQEYILSAVENEDEELIGYVAVCLDDGITWLPLEESVKEATKGLVLVTA